MNKTFCSRSIANILVLIKEKLYCKSKLDIINITRIMTMMINIIRMTIMKIKVLITLSSITAAVGQISSVVPEWKIFSLDFLYQLSQAERLNLWWCNFLLEFKDCFHDSPGRVKMILFAGFGGSSPVIVIYQITILDHIFVVHDQITIIFGIVLAMILHNPHDMMSFS